jgi:hypothetical protein
MTNTVEKLQRRYNLFENCSCGKNVHIVYDRTCCGIDHLQASLSQENKGEKEWQYHLNKIDKCLHRFNKDKAKKEKLADKIKSIQQKKVVIQKVDIPEKPERVPYYDSIGRLRMRKNGKTWTRKINNKLRNAVLARDSYKCVKCSSLKNLHVHHVMHRSDGGKDVIENLTTLCDLCHAEEHRGQPIYNLMVKSLFEYTAI